MKNIRFYLEYKDSKEKRKDTRKSLKHHNGNCLAVPLDESNRFLYFGNSLNIDCFGALFFYKKFSCL